MEYSVTLEDILHYFEESFSQNEFHTLHWPRGAETTRLFIQLMSDHTMEVDSLKRLLHGLSRPDGMSSGWHDLEMRIQHWVTTLPPVFQAEAMAAYFAGVGEHKPKSPEWQYGYQFAVVWRDLLQQDSVSLPVVEAFVVDAQQERLFLRGREGYRLACMIDTWLEGIQPVTTLRVIPPEWRS